MLLVAVVFGVLAASLLSLPDAFAEGGDAAPQPCTRRRVARVVKAFVSAYNRGDAERLERIWAQEPHFEWYFVEGERHSGDAQNRSTLGSYFAARHALNDRLRLRSLRVAPRGDDGSFGFGFRLTRTSNQGSAEGGFHGKGSARGPGPLLLPQIPDPNRPPTCVLRVWSMGRDV